MKGSSNGDSGEQEISAFEPDNERFDIFSSGRDNLSLDNFGFSSIKSANTTNMPAATYLSPEIDTQSVSTGRFQLPTKILCSRKHAAEQPRHHHAGDRLYVKSLRVRATFLFEKSNGDLILHDEINRQLVFAPESDVCEAMRTQTG